MLKEMQYSLNYFGASFCPLRIKIPQLPGGFRLGRYLNEYRKSSIKPPGGLFFSSTFEGGLKREGGFI